MNCVFATFLTLVGAGPTGIEEIKVHAFFNGINWESLQK